MGYQVYPQPSVPTLATGADSIYARGIVTDATTVSSVPAGYYAMGKVTLVTSPNTVGFYVAGESYYAQLSSGSDLAQVMKLTTASDIKLQKHWQARTIGGNTAARAMIYGDGIYIAALSSGTSIYTNSGNPLDAWTARTCTSQDYTAGAYGAGETEKYVFIGGSSVVITSTDSITWTSRTAATSTVMLSGTHGNGTYVFGGQGGIMQLSTNGITWTLVTTPNNGNTIRRKIIYANSKYITAGDDNTITHSTDAITWTSVTTPAAGINFYGITYGGDKYVAVGTNATIVTSTDLVTWTTRDGQWVSTTQTLNSVIWDGSNYYISGSGSAATWDTMRVSTDGITWSRYFGNFGSQTNTGDRVVYTDKIVWYGNTSQVFVKESTTEVPYIIYKYNL